MAVVREIDYINFYVKMGNATTPVKKKIQNKKIIRLFCYGISFLFIIIMIPFPVAK